MKKFSMILSILTVIVCCICGWKLNSVIEEHDEMKSSISSSQAKQKSLEIESKEFADEHAARFSRERRKNQQMEEEILNLSTEKTKLESAYSSKMSEIEKLRSSKEENEKKMVDLKVEIRANEGKLSALKQKALEVKREIPQIEAEIQGNEAQGQQEIRRSSRMQEALTNYAEITKVLKEHYVRTLDSLYEEKYERPWLETGEMIKLHDFSLDLESGLLGLPVGQEIGLEPGTFLSIGHSGRLICKIRIKEVAQKKSVALIMPLFGNPSELNSLESFDLTHL